ncbi:MAG: helix-turn-helix transcriptional regulator [Eubacterium sp.]|jgi:DNA-binding Xre family transcriptional regulator|nr:helix-turn-helix transcriptional regulator [Eubacterium sp.]
MSFTDKLDALMAEKGINKSILSKESGIPYTTIAGFYSKGTDNVKLSTLKKLSSYLGCSIDYLADDNQDEVSTIAAHFDGNEYTEDELNEIRQFAEFVKNKRK